MYNNLEPINENERKIDWKEVEYKVAIICNKFRTSVEPRFIDDLAQELRIHAFYKSDDYYDLQRKAIDFWRSLKLHHMPEMPYFDLEFLGTTTNDNHEDLEFQDFVQLIQKKLNEERSSTYENEIRLLAIQIFDIILADIINHHKPVTLREASVSPYHNKRISCSYLWEVLGNYPGEVKYRRIRKAVKLLGDTIRELNTEGLWTIDIEYLI